MAIRFQLLPLKILDYHFTECSVTVMPPEKGEPFQYKMSKEFSISTNFDVVPDLAETAQVRVRIALPNNPPEGERYNLYFNIDVVGLFENMSKKEKLADIKEIVEINAAAMLTSAVRERLAAMTAGSPYGKYILPALSISRTAESSKKAQ